MEFFSGGVHPNRSLISCSFDTETGDVLTLSDVLTNADVAEALYLKVMDGLDRRSEELNPGQSVWNDDYQDIVREHFDLEHTSSECWYFTETGMHFYFSPYEIAPYAVGEVDIEIAYSELNGILKETYFPEPAAYEDTFSLNAARKEQIDATLFHENIPVNLTAEGTEIAVFTGAVIHQVQLEQEAGNASQQPNGSRVIFCSQSSHATGFAVGHCRNRRHATGIALDTAKWGKMTSDLIPFAKVQKMAPF